jgi:hypothetical protein
MVLGLMVLALLLGSGSFMVADIMRADSGETTAYANTWPVEHPVYFGSAVGLVTLVLGLLLVSALNDSYSEGRETKRD